MLKVIHGSIETAVTRNGGYTVNIKYTSSISFLQRNNLPFIRMIK
ncbi:hypothetical protein GCM10007111_26830 [Virgibacillus kapii]|uniref:Uncharacterized protein n=2 Tax=Virgibacillus TaxID=84406 RepID=A0A024QGI0_9BACI|nr:hypothetical protein GCM10007111_26830 [Virgibacillus kapii]CDQ41604.1 hypothetical protein BN990_03978 [Virgibacillus massiliensis]